MGYRRLAPGHLGHHGCRGARDPLVCHCGCHGLGQHLVQRRKPWWDPTGLVSEHWLERGVDPATWALGRCPTTVLLSTRWTDQVEVKSGAVCAELMAHLVTAGRDLPLTTGLAPGPLGPCHPITAVADGTVRPVRRRRCLVSTSTARPIRRRVTRPGAGGTERAFLGAAGWEGGRSTLHTRLEEDLCPTGAPVAVGLCVRATACEALELTAPRTVGPNRVAATMT